MPTWTPEQLAFISEIKSSTQSLCLEAVAGSGKTTTLVEAVRNINPNLSVIALAFNKQTAEVLSTKMPRNTTSCTLNSLGHSIWAKSGKRKLDSRKISRIVNSWLSQNLPGESGQAHWRPLCSLINSCRSAGIVPENWHHKVIGPEPRALTLSLLDQIAEANDFILEPWYIRIVEELLGESIAEAITSTIDFDDQLYMSTYFSLDMHWPKFDIVVIDEAQDLSSLQHDMLARLGHESRLIVVGDTNQAIYGWRGASCHSMDELCSRFGLKRMPLTVSFRCPATVIEEAKAVVPHIRGAKPGGTVRTQYLTEDTTDQTAFHLSDFVLNSAVLCRTNAPLIRLGLQLVANKTPCFFAGRDIGPKLGAILKSLPQKAPITEELSNWYLTRRAELIDKNYLFALDRHEDEYAALSSVLSIAEVTTVSSAIEALNRLLMKSPTANAVELSTIHKSKGKEWPTVYFLNPQDIPSFFVKKSGNADALQQEENLRYVAITRSLDTLIYLKTKTPKGE